MRATELGLEALTQRSMTSGLLRELHKVLLTGVRGNADRPGEGLVEFFLAAVVDQSRDAATRAKKLADLQLEWREQAQAAPHVSGALLKAVDRLFQHPYVDAPAIEGRLGVSHPIVLKMLKKMMQLGFVSEVTGRARAQLFRSDPILDVLK